jgi:hypothetical protein
MSNYLFQNDQEPSSIEREVIARQFVRSLERVDKFQVEQLYEDSWVALKVRTPGKLRKLFKRFKDKRYTLIHDNEGVFIYIDEKVTPIDVRMLIGEIIYKSRTINDSKLDTLRKAIGTSLWKLGRYIYRGRNR